MERDVATDAAISKSAATSSASVESASGPAFPVLIKASSTLLVIGLLYWGAGVLGEIVWADVSTSAGILYGSALLITLTVWLWILRSRTSISHEAIEQTWLWHKRVLIKDITQAKFIYVPYLSWLIAPRLIVRAGIGLNVFYSADPTVQRLFALLVRGQAK